MNSYLYRWSIPPEESESFIRDWQDLTQKVATKFGLKKAKLYESENGNYISVTTWPDEEARQGWITELKNHPLREKYRPFRLSGESLVLLAEIDS